MSCNSCARIADIEMNVVLPFSKFIKSLLKSELELIGPGRVGAGRSLKTHQNLPCCLHVLFAPGNVIIYNDKVSVRQKTLY